MSDIHEIKEIVEVLTQASDAYYNDDTPTMSDADFDALETNLRNLDGANPYFLSVGSDSRGGKVPLPVSMGSLDQVYEGETVKWIAKEGLGDIELIAADKLDGNSILLVYSDVGDLQIAFTRGNGTHGQDVTRHVRQMSCIPHTGVKGIRFVIAEVIMADATFENVKGDLEKVTGNAYKNPRNFVAGQMNKKVATDIFYEHVDVVTFGLRETTLTKFQQYALLDHNGFTVAGFKVFEGHELNDEILTEHLADCHKHSKWALDGIVLDVNDAARCKAMDASRKSSSLNPAFAKKFKVGQADNVAIATVVDVHWKVSKDGYIKPRVEIEPVDLVGVTVTFATGFNAKFITDNGIGAGAEITITRSGDVIPFIKNVIKSAEVTSKPDAVQLSEYTWSEPNAKGDRIDYVLVDVDMSDDVKFRRLEQFFTSMDVDFFGEKSLMKLYERLYRTPEDVITADVRQIQDIVGNANGEKGMRSLAEKLTNVKPWVLAGSHPAFGRGVGKRKLKKVFEIHNRFSDFRNLTLSQLTSVEGIEEKTAQKILDGMAEFMVFLNTIGDYYTGDYAVEEKITDGKLSGMSFCFTGGKLKDAMATIVELGGEIHSSVKKDTTHLVCKDKDSGSGKLAKAQANGTVLLSHDELEGMLA